MEPNFLTFGIPDLSSRGIQFASYGPNSIIVKQLMTFLNNGKIGIGTQVPESWVDIYQNSTASVPHLTLHEDE